MDIQRLATSLSLKIIIQYGVVVAAVIVLVAVNFDVIYPFYFENQLTNTGIVINSAILFLLFIGLANILYHLLRYRREEMAITQFARNAESLQSNLMAGLAVTSIVAKRHATMRLIQNGHGKIDHSALASMLNADEAIHFGLIRFINNILILTGVFGTIVSLSVALLGASDLIDSADASLGGMGLVIHGMSTALSTTITAIISYAIFGYFYTRLNDVQTHFLSGVEHLTSVYLLPQYVKSSDDIVHTTSELIKAVIHATDKLKLTQDTYHEAAVTLQHSISTNQNQIATLNAEMDNVKKILREGFRLPPIEHEY